MTVVPCTSATALLICDQCGAQDNAAGAGSDTDVVWPLVASAGWTGSPFATGIHRCPRCGDAGPVAAIHQPPVPSHTASYQVRMDPEAGAVVVTPLADIDSYFAETLREALGEALESSSHVVLDLHAVHLIDSAGLGLLVRTHQEARHRGGSLHLVAPSRFVLTVLHTMRLDTLFPHHPGEEEALQAICRGQACGPVAD